jgi:hypothetical protein
MTRTFFPETGIIPVGARYRPLYRMFTEDDWRAVRKNKVIVDYPTADKARQAARECVEAILNPPLRSEVMEEATADILGIADWHEARTARAAQEQQAAFGTIFVKGRAVEVERRKRG